MHPAIKAIVGLAVGAAIVTTASTAQAADTAAATLRPVAGRYTDTPDKYVGGGSAAKAYRNNDGSYTLTKLATTQTNAYAALIVEGVQGSPIADLDRFSFDVVDGRVGGGSPRLNLYFDNDGNGEWSGLAVDGYAMVSAQSSTDITLIDGLVQGEESAVTSYVGAEPLPTAEVLSLSILVDVQGTSTIDNVTLNESSLG